MLATNVRVRPCSERYIVSSLTRSTVRTSPSWARVMPSGTLRLMVPLGPFTVTTPSAIETVTDVGTVMGLRPIRDISAPPGTWAYQT
jgi:hypothetical protein